MQERTVFTFEKTGDLPAKNEERGKKNSSKRRLPKTIVCQREKQHQFSNVLKR